MTKTGRPITKHEVKSALQMSGVYGRVIDKNRITLPYVSIQHKKEDEFVTLDEWIDQND
jgi:hypothetical protein